MIVTTVALNEEERLYLKSKGINMSKFLRQAVQAHKDGTFEYQYI